MADDELELARLAYGNARFASQTEMAAAGLSSPQGLSLGFIYDEHDSFIKRPIRYGGDQHSILIAATRSGKDRDIINSTLLDDKGSFIVVDIKGQNAAITMRKRREMHGDNVFLLNPFGLHGLPVHCYNPLEAIDPDADTFVADVTALVESIIIIEGKDPHWAESARELIVGIILWLKLKQNLGRWATLNHMRAIITLRQKPKKKKAKAKVDNQRTLDAIEEPEAEELSLEGELTRMVREGPDYVRERVQRFIGNYSDEAQSVLSTAITQTSFLSTPTIQKSLSETDFNFKDLKKKRGTIYLILPANYIDAFSRWLRLIITSAMSELMSEPVGPAGTVTFILGEFATITQGGFPQIQRGMGLAAGFGIRLFPILQDITQLQMFSEKGWETFLANAGTVQFFTAGDMTTGAYISERSGTLPTAVRQGSYNKASSTGSTNGQNPTTNYGSSSGSDVGFNWQSRPLMMMADTLNLPRNESVIFVYGFDQVFKIKREAYNLPGGRFEGMYDPDPYHPKPSHK